jgi:hypothetical protein
MALIRGPTNQRLAASRSLPVRPPGGTSGRPAEFAINRNASSKVWDKAVSAEQARLPRVLVFFDIIGQSSII